jgi:hypothetical protein
MFFGRGGWGCVGMRRIVSSFSCFFCSPVRPGFLSAKEMSPCVSQSFDLRPPQLITADPHSNKPLRWPRPRVRHRRRFFPLHHPDANPQLASLVSRPAAIILGKRPQGEVPGRHRQAVSGRVRPRQVEGGYRGGCAGVVGAGSACGRAEEGYADDAAEFADGMREAGGVVEGVDRW